MLMLTKAPEITDVEITKHNNPITAREVPHAVFQRILTTGVNVSVADRQAFMVLLDDGSDRYVFEFRVSVQTRRDMESILTLALSRELSARG